jgi:hypothetical protein
MDLTIHTRVSNVRVYEELKGIQGVKFVASLILHVLSCICIFVNCALSTEDQNDVNVLNIRVYFGVILLQEIINLFIIYVPSSAYR